jgi:hypothetical protein
VARVDFLAVERSTGDAVLRVRALVVEHLSAECYGGQTFHLDNNVVDNIRTGNISLHGGRYVVKGDSCLTPRPHPPPAQSVKEMRDLERAAGMFVTTGEVEERMGVQPEQLTKPEPKPKPEQPTVPGSRNRVAEDPHHDLRSPSVAGLCTRCDGSNYGHNDSANHEVQDAKEKAAEVPRCEG